MKKSRSSPKRKPSPSSRKPVHATSAAAVEPTERFSVGSDGRTISRRIRRKDGSIRSTTVAVPYRVPRNASQDDLSAIVDLIYLKKNSKYPRLTGRRSTLRVVDLFSSCGFMTLGAADACVALGKRLKPILAIESNKSALAVYEQN